MFETQRRRSFPLPDYDLDAPGEVTVSVSGRILDERYTRLLMEQPGLTLGQVILLDRVQKRQRISHAEHQRLRQAGLVEGRYPNCMVAAAVAKATGDAARHIRERGFNKRYYVDLIVALVQEHGPVGRREVDELLLSKLPDRMTAEQKRRKVHNLLQELRRAGRIANQGSRAEPRWVIAQPQAASA
jgi:ATP-dependent DNA helicase RecG